MILPVPLPKALRIFWLGSLMAFAISCLNAAVKYHAGMSPSGWNPLGDPLFGDLLEYQSTFILLHTSSFFNSTVYPVVSYPPFGSVLFALLYATANPSIVYAVFCAVAVTTAITFARKSIIRDGLGAATATFFLCSVVVLSFPVEGLVQRGNLELFVWIFVGVGTWAFLHKYYDTAAILWAFAAATKLYPLILFALFISHRRFRSLAIATVSLIGIWVASTKYLGPTFLIAWSGSIRNVFGYQGIRVAEWSLHELAANHSAFNLVKTVVTILGFSAKRLTLPYYAIGGTLFLIVFFTRVRKMPVANQLLIVTLVMVMLPPVSYFYTLVHLYGPWLLLVSLALRSHQAGKLIKGLGPTILLFLPVFCSFTLFTYPHVLLFGGLVQGFFLLVLLLYALRYPFAEPGDVQTRPI